MHSWERRRVGVRTDQEMPPETRRNHVGSSIIEGPWPAVTSGFLVGETPELQLGTSMLGRSRLADLVGQGLAWLLVKGGYLPQSPLFGGPPGALSAQAEVVGRATPASPTPSSAALLAFP